MQISLTEIERARAIGERALRTINFKNETERLNVWVALLNLEMSYGTDESVQETFGRAKSNCDGETISLRMVEVYGRNQMMDKAEALLKSMSKQFRDSVKMWSVYMRFKLKQDDPEGARYQLERAIQALPKRQHVEVITRFARLECEMGAMERGRTVMESIVTNYPKRTDIWNVYLDMEVKHGDHDRARQLFERAISLSLTPRKIKFFFKKYLDFEAKHGSDETVEKVKDQAREYVRRLTEE